MSLESERSKNCFGHGGAICAVNANISFKNSSKTKFINNEAVSKGGSIYVTGPGKTGHICTSTGFHFLSVGES